MFIELMLAIKAIKNFFRIVCLALLAVFVIVAPTIAESPTDFVRQTLDNVLTINNNSTQTDVSRALAVHQIIEKAFDFKQMVKKALGPCYKRISVAQRVEFTDTFSYLFQDSYTRQVLNFFKRGSIKYLQENIIGKKAQVDTLLIRSNDIIPVTYFIHSIPSDRWVFYDVMVDGRSILNGYQIEFAQVIRNESFEFLLMRMKQHRLDIEQCMKWKKVFFELRDKYTTISLNFNYYMYHSDYLSIDNYYYFRRTYVLVKNYINT